VDLLLVELESGNKEILEGARPMFNPESSLYEHSFGDITNLIYRVKAKF
jgi:hypothetical protein